ncbi:MAG: anthranilate phosphoribosyltransferase [candidate division Zixibacteria bacterium]|jgi:anthranilate phosphoribosyltransferase|nr:anthranilate phosphoribosyltransferase [candidate division Zixibacteria bacterium]
MISEAIKRLLEGEDLSCEDTQAAIEGIIDGAVTAVQAASFLTALRIKGESVEELVGAARVMRSHVTPIPHSHARVVDTCGTGGDGTGTFNISTTVAFVLAAAGLRVAKHGNRSISSRSGSADVLEALGARLDLSPDQVAACINRVGIGFLYAPSLHPAMRAIAPVRRELGFRTVFNLLGPLTNPAAASHQIIGVFDPAYTELLAQAASALGLQRVFVVYNSHGLDELATCGTNRVSTFECGTVRTFDIDPRQLGFQPCSAESLRGGDAVDNAEITRRVLAGEPGPALDTVVLNAALGLFCAGAADSLPEGIAIARETIESGAAGETLNRFVTFTNRVHRAA